MLETWSSVSWCWILGHPSADAGNLVISQLMLDTYLCSSWWYFVGCMYFYLPCVHLYSHHRDWTDFMIVLAYLVFSSPGAYNLLLGLPHPFYWYCSAAVYTPHSRAITYSSMHIFHTTILHLKVILFAWCCIQACVLGLYLYSDRVSRISWIAHLDFPDFLPN